jgi:8-oxo-dGTP pyrophosphatase MutT (NUDIX family)
LSDSRPAGTIRRFVVVPAAYVFFLRGQHVLLQLRQNTGFMDDHWAAAAAGHVEQGETAYDAARREAREEVGVTDPTLEFVTAMQRTRGGEPIDERIDFFFTCRTWTGEPRIMEPAKAAALEWFPLDGLPDPVVPHELVVLRGLVSGIEPYTTFGFGYRPTMSDEEPLRGSNPNSAGPQTASGGMGVSSERTGEAGPFEGVTDGLKDTSTRDEEPPRDELPPEQRPDQDEENPEGLRPKAGYPSLDPRSDD